MQFVPSCEEIFFFTLAELLGLLHLGLVVIPVLCKDLDLGSMLLGQVSEFGSQPRDLGLLLFQLGGMPFLEFLFLSWRKKASQ